MLGIACALENTIKIADTDEAINHIYVFTDNIAAGDAIRFLESNNTHRITLEWTPGHKGTRGNERADELAKEGTELDPETDTPTFAAMHCIAKENTLNAWKGIWHAKLNREDSRFHAANRFLPALKPRHHFIENDRKIYGQMLQARMGYCFAVPETVGLGAIDNKIFIAVAIVVVTFSVTLTVASTFTIALTALHIQEE
ncbi:hypothetical protein CONPUDRAFT_158790 [Coniophora puteana RWD-64-598 SS2]|uniref:RNase H type-1 domain-containing protein n=1 Tax=Coniophora puteana (strain RWD-64-598) TaxID=741705 RepID=A0A5M3MAW3_CONPW|nr:uncharacterized protein CONPUDRAFT_158790 [Coniophora puteana RWD-64-598 SS2]EIW76014.1 hypothetical protein CONPUDRAFT_158790 [Coniophora puteana RWD-64-598 SS2]